MKQKFLKPMTLGICMLLMVACNTKSEAPVEEAPAVDARMPSEQKFKH